MSKAVPEQEWFEADGKPVRLRLGFTSVPILSHAGLMRAYPRTFDI